MTLRHAAACSFIEFHLVFFSADSQVGTYVRGTITRELGAITSWGRESHTCTAIEIWLIAAITMAALFTTYLPDQSLWISVLGARLIA